MQLLESTLFRSANEIMKPTIILKVPWLYDTNTHRSNVEVCYTSMSSASISRIVNATTNHQIWIFGVFCIQYLPSCSVDEPSDQHKVTPLLTTTENETYSLNEVMESTCRRALRTGKRHFGAVLRSFWRESSEFSLNSRYYRPPFDIHHNQYHLRRLIEWCTRNHSLGGVIGA